MAGNAQILVRSDTTTNWTTVNPILANKEITFDKTANKFKIGDGALTWTALPYVAGAGSGAVTASGYTMATSRMLGRITAATGAVEELTDVQGRSVLGLGTGALVNITISATAPAAPATNDLWVDTT